MMKNLTKLGLICGLMVVISDLKYPQLMNLEYLRSEITTINPQINPNLVRFFIIVYKCK